MSSYMQKHVEWYLAQGKLYVSIYGYCYSLFYCFNLIGEYRMLDFSSPTAVAGCKVGREICPLEFNRTTAVEHEDMPTDFSTLLRSLEIFPNSCPSGGRGDGEREATGLSSFHSPSARWHLRSRDEIEEYFFSTSFILMKKKVSLFYKVHLNLKKPCIADDLK